MSFSSPLGLNLACAVNISKDRRDPSSLDELGNDTSNFVKALRRLIRRSSSRQDPSDFARKEAKSCSSRLFLLSSLSLFVFSCQAHGGAIGSMEATEKATDSPLH